MSLISNLFKSDQKLQACLVQDSAHVLTGASGEHVAKIQAALGELDRATIASDELQSMRYGASTANAVLDYKTKRGIINRTYQTTADNIVGKMTIARLDAEMAARENASKHRMSCGDPRCDWVG